MTPKQFVAMQLAKSFKARKIPDLKHMQHGRQLTCSSLRQGFRAAHSSGLFDAEWLYEGYGRFQARPSAYYANEILPWETILEQT